MATAPTDPEGHVNLSPKGARDTFRILGPTTVAYLDLMGSGIETVAHLRENGRIVVMFCAFEGPPKIVRLHGQGRVLQQDDPAFAELLRAFQPNAEIRSVARSIVVVEVSRISDSCGFVVPRMDFVEERTHLFRWAENKQQKDGDEWMLRYQQANNATSIDGLAGLDLPDQPSDEEIERYSAVGRVL